MLKNTILAILVILIGVVVTIATERYFKNNRGDFFILQQGQPVPDFSFQTINNRAYQFYEFKGRASIIHFWASWCAPCVVEFPELVSLAKDNPNIVILALSSDRTEEAIKRFLSNHAPSLPDNFLIVHDEKGLITRDKFSVFQLPESFIVDKEGLLETHIIGAYKGWNDFIK
jgi:cytochrome c biogenesis protein CcmG, thiol:disulfide interchange protein DsbE